MNENENITKWEDRFTEDMEMTECQWKAHDGQQPDVE